MGSKEINSLKFREGWAFFGVKNMNTPMFMEKKGTGSIIKLELTAGFAKAVKKTQKKEVIQNGSRIEAFSAGYRTGKENSMATIKINGQEIVTGENSRRGINLIVLNGSDHKVILNDSYNTYTAKRDDSSRLVKDLESIPNGSVVIASIKDDGQKNMSTGVMLAFKAMGANDLWKLGYK